MIRPRSISRPRRGFATFLVLWILAICVILVAAIQQSSFRQASAGREAMARVRAAWAARAGVEAMIAVLERDTQAPDPTDAFAVADDMAAAAEGDVGDAHFLVSHTTEPGSRNPGDVLGPADAHARINIALMSPQALMLMPYMTQDVADAILDWMDDDDDVRAQGAEIGQYQGVRYPYEPRNAPPRSMAELELIHGVEPWFVRGEDWNLNNLLDPSEDDGGATWPDDNRDRRLDAQWSAILTTASTDDVLAASGEERLVLSEASEADIAKRLNIDSTQAAAVKTLVSDGLTISDLIRQDLQAMMDVRQQQQQQQRQGRGAAPQRRTRYRALTREQMASLLAETVASAPDPAAPRPGKLNINTCPESMLEYIPGLNSTVADSIIAERAARSKGLSSLMDLLDVPGMSRQRLAAVYPFITVRSNVYVVTSKGTDPRTGIEYEVVATVDRSSLPAVITEWRVR